MYASSIMVSKAAVFVFLLFPCSVVGWGSGSSGSDMTNYADSFNRGWLYDGSAISMKYEGCVWGYIDPNEDGGCLEKSSQDGTSSWYMMSNCRRAQAAFSIFASSSSGNCNSGNFKETFVTTVGVSEFTGWLQDWDSNSPFNNGGGGGNDGWDADNLPTCEQSQNGYVGLGCNSDGTFSINYYQDKYCQSSTGVYDTLSTFNYYLKTYKSCRSLDNAASSNNFASNMNYYTESCSSLDSDRCTDGDAMHARRSSTTSGGRRHAVSTAAHKSWNTKVKYAMGGVLLLASLVMFTGILFTNRRRRKALMQRKFRQARGDKSRRSKRSSSKSVRSRSSRRSKSRPRDSAESGVFT